ncbi:hypothetical protein N7474_005101 [Penicillium riverlandense]|uniref:uncharacterized protein n=1 Tax=Penicillium riverlandense TaxID=1903569 RepID=UPI002546F03D|nr:uncharacterized protein N7474_005101 [Penicillium riverlandense]KAJ5819510.1 hypothetical protein N7474_005101 [Penicillium riverlandense]
MPRNPPWTDEDLDNLPSWFEPRRHQSLEEIEREFLRDFHHYRSLSAIQTKFYDQKKKTKKDVGRLRNEGKTVRGKQIVPPPTVPPLIPRTTVNPETFESSLITNSPACPEEPPCSPLPRSSQEGRMLSKEIVTTEQSPPGHLHVGRSESRATRDMAEWDLLGQSASLNDSQPKSLEDSQTCINIPLSATDMVPEIERFSETEIQTSGHNSIDHQGADENRKEDQHVCGPESVSSQMEGRPPSSLESEILFHTGREAVVSQNHTVVTASPVMSNYGIGSYTEMEFISPPFTATDDQEFMSTGADGAQPALSNQIESRGLEYQENQEVLPENLEQDDNDRDVSHRPLTFVNNHNPVFPEHSRNEAQPEQDTNSTRGSVNPPDNVPPIPRCVIESGERTNLNTSGDHLSDQLEILENSNPNRNLSQPDAQLSSAAHLVQLRDVTDVQPMDAQQEDKQDQDLQTANAGAPVPSAPNFQAASSTCVPGPGQRQAAKPKRKYSRRTKTGCVTCRRRRKKCDEKYPSCKSRITLSGLSGDI